MYIKASGGGLGGFSGIGADQLQYLDGYIWQQSEEATLFLVISARMAEMDVHGRGQSSRIRSEGRNEYQAKVGWDG